MDKLIWFIGIIITYNLLYTITVTMSKKKLVKLKETGRANFIIKRYQLNAKKIDDKIFSIQLGCIDSIILATTFIIILFVPNFVLEMVLAFVIFVPFTLIMYHGLGRYYQKKEGRICTTLKK